MKYLILKIIYIFWWLVLCLTNFLFFLLNYIIRNECQKCCHTFVSSTTIKEWIWCIQTLKRQRAFSVWIIVVIFFPKVKSSLRNLYSGFQIIELGHGPQQEYDSQDRFFFFNVAGASLIPGPAWHIDPQSSPFLEWFLSAEEQHILCKNVLHFPFSSYKLLCVTVQIGRLFWRSNPLSLKLPFCC